LIYESAAWRVASIAVVYFEISASWWRALKRVT
jgi:hypothetical protein